jgi:nucleotide-binding universal stress UspA family protein
MNVKSHALLDSSSTTLHQDTELYQDILIALDSSDHANAAMEFAITLAGLSAEAQITGVHAYAAKLHDVRFRQMEGGLPEQFREEQELERQRDVHDDLITRGLSIITDSYLDQAERDCQQAEITFNRCSLEGKNYRALTSEVNSGNYDLLIMGSLGLGAVEGSRLGTVCQRLARRSNIDMLVIKQPKQKISEGPIVVAIDGSAMAYGGLITALQLGQHWQVPVKVIAVFDPYFHYVAFNRIAGVLSEEAGKVFRFQEQEQLHEEIIDSGLAKIYQGHLDVAESIAKEHNVKIETQLLDGKPHHAISKYVKQINASLLIAGKLGIHADDELDIGGNTENLLHDVDCAVLLSQRQYQPRMEVVADTTTSWTHEAEQAMEHVPDFARNMARMAILRHAQQSGHTVITASIVEEVSSQLCPSHAREVMEEIVAAHDAGELNAAQTQVKGFKKLDWSEDAEVLLSQTEEGSVRNNLRQRAEKKARTEGASQVEKEHLEPFITAFTSDTPVSSIESEEPLYWDAASLARLMRVPEGFMRDSSWQQVEAYARQHDLDEVTLQVVEEGLLLAREGMMQSTGVCPFGKTDKTSSDSNKPQKTTTDIASDLSWSIDAEQRMQKIPEGFMRQMTRQRLETFARRKGVNKITVDVIEQKYSEWNEGSQKHDLMLTWDDDVLTRVEKIPDFVRGMVIKEVERCAVEMNATSVTVAIMNKAMSSWAATGDFHSDSRPDMYKDS